MEEKDVPGHIPSKVQTGLRSEVELHEKAAHKTSPRWCLAWPRESRAWQVVAGRWRAECLCNATLVIREESSRWCKDSGGGSSSEQTVYVVVTGLGDR